jgi:hypothetical protein
MSNIVKRLREGCIYYERNKLFVVDDDATDNLLSAAANIIERQRDALREAEEALTQITNVYIGMLWTSGDDGEESGVIKQAKDAIAAIDSALKEDGE